MLKCYANEDYGKSVLLPDTIWPWKAWDVGARKSLGWGGLHGDVGLIVFSPTVDRRVAVIHS